MRLRLSTYSQKTAKPMQGKGKTIFFLHKSFIILFKKYFVLFVFAFI